MLIRKFNKNTIAIIIALLTILTLFAMSSCKKDITPGNYTLGDQPLDTASWQWQYTYGGVLPNWGTNNHNELYGTKWVLSRYRINGGFDINSNTTIRFIDNTHYTLNNGSVLNSQTYQISIITGSTLKSLTLNSFAIFGSSNYSGQVGQYFVTQALSFEIPINFIDMQSNANITAWFTRIL